MRVVAGYGLIYACWVLDHVPWYDQRWWLFGQRGCAWGVSALGFRLLGRERS